MRKRRVSTTKPTVVLASRSPRRRQLFRRLERPFRSVTPQVEEEQPSQTRSPARVAQRNAMRKAYSVAPRVDAEIVVGADTVVYQQGRLFGKPRSIREAERMLRTLMNGPHWVYTGITCLDLRVGRECTAYERTKVEMRRLSDAEIRRYVRYTNPLDKAGGYAIQERGDLVVTRIEGDFFNVVGLPLILLDRMLTNLGCRRRRT